MIGRQMIGGSACAERRVGFSPPPRGGLKPTLRFATSRAFILRKSNRTSSHRPSQRAFLRQFLTRFTVSRKRHVSTSNPYCAASGKQTMRKSIVFILLLLFVSTASAAPVVTASASKDSLRIAAPAEAGIRLEVYSDLGDRVHD